MSLDDFAYEPEFEVRRKPQIQIPPFECVVCEQIIRDNQWSIRDRQNKPPICGTCVRHWGKTPTMRHLTRNDKLAFYRLSAVTERLNWEIHNGYFGKRRFTAW